MLPWLLHIQIVFPCFSHTSPRASWYGIEASQFHTWRASAKQFVHGRTTATKMRRRRTQKTQYSGYQHRRLFPRIAVSEMLRPVSWQDDGRKKNQKDGSGTYSVPYPLILRNISKPGWESYGSWPKKGAPGYPLEDLLPKLQSFQRVEICWSWHLEPKLHIVIEGTWHHEDAFGV